MQLWLVMRLLATVNAGAFLLPLVLQCYKIRPDCSRYLKGPIFKAFSICRAGFAVASCR
jgi:hypothetical protein